MSFNEINENMQSTNISMCRFIYCKNNLVSIINTNVRQYILSVLPS